MTDFIITGMILVLLINPFIFLYLKHPKLAIINGIFLTFYIVAWFYSINYKGSQEINLAIVSWATLLFVNSIFIIVSCSKLANQWFSTNKITNLLLISSSAVVSFILFLLINNSQNILFALLDILLLYFLPIYLFLTFVFGLLKYDKEQIGDF